MSKQEGHRDAFLETIAHLERVSVKIGGLLGKNGILTFPDHHKLCEGLFLSAWTHWEQYITQLIIEDLAEDPQGFVQKDVKKFRVKLASRRIAERVLQHPDHPKKYVEWSFDCVKQRADALLSPNHRFSRGLPKKTELDLMKRIRNAIAHKGDSAWESFKNLVVQAPFNLTIQQRSGITVGRFLVSPCWNQSVVLAESFKVHRDNAKHLVL